MATALMAKMRIAVKDRPKARAELLRILASYKLDPARTRLLGVFIDRYLKLSEAEMKVFEREMAGFAPEERRETMELLMDIEIKAIERGIEQGLHTGKEDVILRQLRKRLGMIPEEIATRIDRLSSEQLSELSEALLDFSSMTDLELWLAQHTR